MNLQNEIIESFTLENYDWNDKWKHNDTDREESNGNSTIKFIIAVGILQFDDVHPSESIKVGPNKFVFVDEHGNQETEEQNVEDEHKQRNKNLSCWELILGKVLLSIESVKNI